MIVEATAIGNQKSGLFLDDFAWQQDNFHVKAMELFSLSSVGVRDITGKRECSRAKKPSGQAIFAAVVKSKGG
ncbi:MAG: hypothetical protein JRI80_03500 [Deltaproteobacteria bacterium]|nr:hypothetical protein [Deltaproteobacteria bacterium]